MRVNRFFFAHEGKQELEIKTPELVQQISRVLRMSPEEHIALFQGDGFEWSGIITEIKKDSVRLLRKELGRNEREPQREVMLYLSILKRENFEWALEKATEIGVHKVIPLLTERTVKLNLNAMRLQKIAKEAAEQSGRAIVPEVLAPVRFQDALAIKDGEKIFFDIGQGMAPARAEKVSIFIGPEGGWSEGERAQAREAGAEMAGLGRTVLRAETAAIVATFAVLQ